MFSFSNKKIVPVIFGGLLIFTVSFLAYFLFISKFGFYVDEWNLAYAGQLGGGPTFFDVFAIDRPFRTYLVAFMFQLFGLHANYHGYASFFLRFIVSLGVFWLTYQLFPKNRWISIFIASLFAVYPGFLEQPIGFDYQTHHIALALEIFSIAGMVAAWRSKKKQTQVLLILMSVVFSFLCFLLMEIYIGLEGFRFIILIYLACDGQDIRDLWVRPRNELCKAILFWLPYLFTSIVFLVWRIVFFHSARASTDISALMTKFSSSFVLSSASFVINLIQSYINVVISGWIVPFYNRTESLRLRDSLLAIFIGIIAGAIIYFSWKWFSRKKYITEPSNVEGQSKWLFWIGTVCVLSTLAPSVFGDRGVNYDSYSRFAYPGVIGAVLIVWAILIIARSNRIQGLLLSIIIGLSVTTHVANSIFYAQKWQSVRDFWWQTSWRIPQLIPETLVVAHYSNSPIPEDYNVRVPADLIYYPESYKPDGVTRSPIGSIVLTRDNIYAIQMGIVLQDREKRGVVSNQDLRNPIVISMPQMGSCVHALDGKALELSRDEDLSIQLIAGYSDIGQIDIDAPVHTPPSALFGKEPDHGWCYFFEKASLARQQKDWQEVVRLGKEAIGDGLHPVDKVEWLPFIQGFAFTGYQDEVREIASRVLDDPYLTFQGCKLFSNSDSTLTSSEVEGQTLLKEIFCK